MTKEPKDFGIKIASNSDEALWHEMVERTAQAINSLEKESKVQKAILEMAKRKEREARDK